MKSGWVADKERMGCFANPSGLKTLGIDCKSLYDPHGVRKWIVTYS